VKNDYGTEYEAWALNGLEEPSKKKMLPIIDFLDIIHLLDTSIYLKYCILASCCSFHLESISFLQSHVQHYGLKSPSLHVSTNIVIIRC
jgi:hypothetical protein